MSVLKQNYIVECYDGRTCEYNGTIHEAVKYYGDRFRQLFGTAFNLRKPSEGTYQYSNRESAFYVRVGEQYQHFNYRFATKEQWWSKETRYFDRLADCKYIIRNGFGNVVHPDVIYRAYLEEFGAQKTKFDDNVRSKRYFRGPNWPAHGVVRDGKAYRLLKQRVESDQKLDDAPPMRKHRGFYALNDCKCWWDDPMPRTVQKSWKQQTKVKKQWMKRV